MSFSEKSKDEVKYKSRYMCVFCKQLGPLDIHHIIPQSKGGADDIDNAICLCPTHHRKYGDLPEFYEYLKKERNKWYRYCKKFLADTDDIKHRFDDLEKKVTEIQRQTKSEEYLKPDVMRGIMISAYDTIISNLNEAKKKLEKKDLTPSDIISISVAASSATATSGTVNTIALSSIIPDMKSSAPYSNLAECPIGGGFFGFLFSYLVISLERRFDNWNEKMNASLYLRLIFTISSISIVSFVVNQTAVRIFLFFTLK